jgi:hypothetical protein
MVACYKIPAYAGMTLWLFSDLIEVVLGAQAGFNE